MELLKSAMMIDGGQYAAQDLAQMRQKSFAVS